MFWCQQLGSVINSLFICLPCTYNIKSSKIPDSVLYSKSLIPNRALLLLMNCLNPSRPLNSNSDSSTHKLQSGLYTTLHCLRLRTILVNRLIFHNLIRHINGSVIRNHNNNRQRSRAITDGNISVWRWHPSTSTCAVRVCIPRPSTWTTWHKESSIQHAALKGLKGFTLAKKPAGYYWFKVFIALEASLLGCKEGEKSLHCTSNGTKQAACG